jgi:hypothetical protein
MADSGGMIGGRDLQTVATVTAGLHKRLRL